MDYLTINQEVAGSSPASRPKKRVELICLSLNLYFRKMLASTDLGYARIASQTIYPFHTLCNVDKGVNN